MYRFFKFPQIAQLHRKNFTDLQSPEPKLTTNSRNHHLHLHAQNSSTKSTRTKNKFKKIRIHNYKTEIKQYKIPSLDLILLVLARFPFSKQQIYLGERNARNRKACNKQLNLKHQHRIYLLLRFQQLQLTQNFKSQHILIHID